MLFYWPVHGCQEVPASEISLTYIPYSRYSLMSFHLESMLYK